MPPPITRALFWPSGFAVAHWKEEKQIIIQTKCQWYQVQCYYENHRLIYN